jgi:uncharacterized protein (DUF58 family)
VLRERARETRPDVEIGLEVRRPVGSGDDWPPHFERRIRDVASRAVAHLKRGDGVTIVTTAGDRVRADRNVGADRILRFLALVETVESDAAATGTPAESGRRPRPASVPPVKSTKPPVAGAKT